jgi:hypothetical protein
MDTTIKLTVVLERETRFLDPVNQLSLQEGEKTTECVTPFLWLLKHGYVALSDEFVFEGTTLILKDRKHRDFYMASRRWEREGMPPYPYESDYCLMTCEDLENDQATRKLIEVNATKLTRIVEIIFDKASGFFDMTRFPTIDKGCSAPF